MSNIDEQLIYFVGEGWAEKALDLIDNGANIKARNKEGETLLHLAALFEFTELALALIARGANVNARDKNGITPLIWAAFNADQELTIALIRNGADIEARDSIGDSPLKFISMNKTAEVEAVIDSVSLEKSIAKKTQGTQKAIQSI